MWSGVDELIAEEMTGNINIRIAEKSGVSFNGNQAVKISSARNPAKIT